MSAWDEAMAELDAIAAETFGTSVVYRRTPSAAGVEALAIFGEEPVDGRFSDDGDAAGRAVATVEPVLFIQRAVLAGIEPDDGDVVELTVGGEPRTYRVTHADPDGPAGWRLSLQRVRARP